MMADSKQTLSTWLIRKVQKYGPHVVEVLGKTYEISEDVFNPKFFATSEFMAEHVSVTPQDEVLDVGTGSGILAITAGQVARRVVAVDINPEAVRYARKNAKLNGLEDTVSVLEGDLFSPLESGCRFDVILFNPPYFEGTPTTPLEHALYDPDKRLARRFLGEAKDYLKPGGYVQFGYSTNAEHDRVEEMMVELGWSYQVIATKELGGVWSEETLLIYKLTPNR
jgi:release factor glutamine methyltransferase